MIRRALLLLLVVCAAAASAQRPPAESNLERGFAPDKVYNFGSIDNVNLFNGNLVLTLPIGPAYPIGGGSSYRLVLSYNSTLWDHVNVLSEPTNGDPPTRMPWTYPNRSSNAGFGWSLSLGRILAQYDAENNSEGPAYVSPDGNTHRFVGADPQVSRDGTYLRLHAAASPSATPLLDAPDGSTSTFWVAGGAPSANGYGTLAEMDDAFGNWVKVAPTVENDLVTKWTITDSAGRTHYVYFKPFSGTTNVDSFPNRTAQQNYLTVVDRVEVEIPPAAGTTTVRRATYRFVYRNDQGEVDKPTSLLATGVAVPGWPSSFNLPLLREIQLPDGSNYQAAYNTPPGSTSAESGQIVRLSLPTGGTISWEYGAYQYPTEPCSEKSWRHSNFGVRKRTLDSGIALQPSAARTAVWTYLAAFGETDTPFPCPDENGKVRVTQRPFEQITTVTKPDGSTELHHFTVTQSEDPAFSPATLWEYGSPQYRNRHDGTPRKRGLSVEYKDLAGATRSKYVQYVFDGTAFDANGAIASVTGDLDGRVRSERMVYEDQTTTVDTDFDDFDGYGHYRKTVVTSNAQPFAVRTSFTNFNPGSTTLDPYRSDWILETFSEQWTSQYGHTARSESCFDTRGFLRKRRIWAADGGSAEALTRSSSDVLVVFEPTAGNAPAEQTYGNVVREAYYGGDRQSVATDPLTSAGTARCSASFALPAAPVYDLRHTYAYAVRNSSTYYDGGTPLPFKLLDVTVDRSGAVTAERDSAGVETRYAYTAWGAIESVTPPVGAATSYTYKTVTGSITEPASVTVTRGDTSTQYFFDGLGRYWRDERLTPSASAVHEITYDGLGRKTAESDVRARVAGEAQPWQLSFDGVQRSTTAYDGFGRPTTVTAPDGSTTRYTYPSAMETRRSVTIRRPGGDQDQSTTEKMDGLGQLVSVTEAAGAGDALLTAAYAYDAAGRLVRADLSTASATQRPRIFTYDNRGFLLREQSPEVDEIAYGSYDPRGHAAVRTYAGDTAAGGRLDFTFDAAERLTKVEATRGGQKRELKLFTYATAGSAASPYQLGKLIAATRHNDLPNVGDVKVTEAFTYAEPGGRLSAKETTLELVAGNSVTQMQHLTQDYSYDPLGLPAAVTYPRCTAAGAASYPGCGETNWDAVQFGYSRGLLTTVTAAETGAGGAVVATYPMARSITYHPDGMRSTLVHGNDVTDETIRDSGMPRPLRIDVKDTQSCAAAQIVVPPASQTVDRGTSVTLTATVAGSAAVTVTWYDGAGHAVGQGTSFTTPAIATTVTYQVVAWNACGKAVRSATVTAADPLAVPANVLASYSGGTGVSVTWSGVAGATAYEVFRRADGSGFVSLGLTGGAPFTDAGAGASAAYVYAVKAADGARRSAISGGDLVSVRSFSSIVPGSYVRTGELDQLLSAVNAVGLIAGQPSATWSSILPSGVAAPAFGGLIRAAHLSALRQKLDSHLVALGLRSGQYSTPDLRNQRIRAADVSETQQAMR